MCGILEAKVQNSAEGAKLISITHAHVPPYCIENRSSDHYIRFVQNDDNAVVFELPPMSSTQYTWDSPLGKKKLRAVVIPKEKSKSHQLDEALERERDYEVASQNINSNAGESQNGDETVDTYDSDEDKTTIESESATEPLLQALEKGASPDSRELNKTERYRSPRKKAVYTLDSRSYDMKKVGSQIDLPCPSPKECDSGHSMMSSKLFAHLRISAGTKILSFSDSTWMADQVQAGQLRKGGDFKTALYELNIEGIGLYIMDDFPKEVMAVILRDIQFHKPSEFCFIVWHCIVFSH